MNVLEKLIAVCQAYKTGAYGIEEFQSRIDTILLPDGYKNTLEVDQHNAHNRLEEIIFCYPESDHKKHADEVADYLIHAVILAQNKKNK